MVIVTGPTATGKTSLATRLCLHFNGELISIDSRQVYRGMDIGTGKDLDEFTIDGTRIPYHLIDIVEPTDEYNLARFLGDAEKAVIQVTDRGKLPVLAGGTALYLNALLNGYKMPGGPPSKKQREKLRQQPTESLQDILKTRSEELFANLPDKHNRIRLIRAIEKSMDGDTIIQPFSLAISPLVIGVYYPRTTVHERIEQRLQKRLDQGMIDEVEHLHENGVSWEKLEFFGLEYRYIAYHLQGKLTYDEMREQLLIKIRQFARSQDVWFRKMERNGTIIHWLDQGNLQDAVDLVQTFLADAPLPQPAIRLDAIRYGPRSS